MPTGGVKEDYSWERRTVTQILTAIKKQCRFLEGLGDVIRRIQGGGCTRGEVSTPNRSKGIRTEDWWRAEWQVGMILGKDNL